MDGTNQPLVGRQVRIGSLFSGIGGLDLGLQWALGPDAHTVFQVERDPFARAVLAAHWPDADRSVTDVRDAGRDTLPRVDLLAGGFPCVNISTASRGVTQTDLDGDPDEGSALWWEFHRIVRELEPRWVVIENVADRWDAWLPELRGSLHRIGYGSVPLDLSAADCGAPHLRRRVGIVSYPYRESESPSAVYAKMGRLSSLPKLGRWPEPPQGLGMDDGFSPGMDRRRLRTLGNAAVPRWAYHMGRVVKELSCD